MEFENPKPIYRQIGDRMCEKILRGEWAPGERIPSVRDMAMAMQVNPNTAMRAFDELQTEGIIFNRRGVGYFAADDALEKALERGRREFLDKVLPGVFASMEMLDIPAETMLSYYEKFKTK